MIFLDPNEKPNLEYYTKSIQTIIEERICNYHPFYFLFRFCDRTGILMYYADIEKLLSNLTVEDKFSTQVAYSIASFIDSTVSYTFNSREK